jgi:precorrin-6B C5,15-methyltransferase / cobalt-precorrin-6B C5,C15-methyltransferase
VIAVLGWDGSPLSSAATETLEKATLVVGGRRHLDAVPVPRAARRVVLGELAAGLEALAAHDGDAVVIASGDPGFFGITRALRQRRLPVDVRPAVSSVALAFARLGLPWEDAAVVSTHGRELGPSVNVCRAFRKVAVLTGPGAGPTELGAALVGSGRRLVVASNLGTPDEQVVACTPAEAAGRCWAEPNVVLVLADGEPAEAPVGWVAGLPPAPEGWALPEDAFDHRDSMVTKSEVRALALARLGPRAGDCVWDVGAGSGSVAVECARFGAAVVAVESDDASCQRIKANATAYGVEVSVVSGRAPAALGGLPEPDAVFVGGGGVEVVRAVAALPSPRRVVVALAALDRVAPTRDALVAAGFDVEGTQLAAARLVDLPDGGIRLAATNPVMLVWGFR